MQAQEYVDPGSAQLKREAAGASANTGHVLHTEPLYGRKQPAANISLPGASSGTTSKAAAHSGATAKSLNAIQMVNNMQSNQQLGKFNNPNEYLEDAGSRNGQSAAAGQGSGQGSGARVSSKDAARKKKS